MGVAVGVADLAGGGMATLPLAGGVAEEEEEEGAGSPVDTWGGRGC